MKIDDIFTERTENTSEIVSGNVKTSQEYKSYSSARYADWVVENASDGFYITFDMEFIEGHSEFFATREYPDGRPLASSASLMDISKDELFCQWLSDRICGILDVGDIPHSTVNFEDENYRTYKSMKVRVFVLFRRPLVDFFKTFYKLFKLTEKSASSMHLSSKIRFGFYDKCKTELDNDINISISVRYIEKLPELCNLLQIIETLNPRIDNKLDFYQKFFKFKFIGRDLSKCIRGPYYFPKASDIANDIHIMLCTIRETIELYEPNKIITEGKELERYFIIDSIRFANFIRKLLINSLGEYNLFFRDNSFWKAVTSDLRNLCIDDIYLYLRDLKKNDD